MPNQTLCNCSVELHVIYTVISMRLPDSAYIITAEVWAIVKS